MFEKQALVDFKSGQKDGKYTIEVKCPYCMNFLLDIREPEMPMKIEAKVTCQHWIWEGNRPLKICGKTSKVYIRKDRSIF